MAHTTLLLVDTTRMVEALNALLREESAFVDTYQLAIDKLGPEAPSELFDCRSSHHLRCDLLARRIHELRGLPVEGGGIWGAFSRLLTGGAALLGRKVVIATLVEDEERGLAHYHDQMPHLDADSLRLLELDLLPEQRRTHRLMAALQREYG